MSTVCYVLATGVFVGLFYIFHEIKVKGKSCTSKAKLHGKTAIVTGKRVHMWFAHAGKNKTNKNKNKTFLIAYWVFACEFSRNAIKTYEKYK